jgi:hypothetical protein
MGNTESVTTGQKRTDMDISEAAKAYIAGYMDGEGCFRWHVYSPEVGVKSCNPYPMKYISSIFGGTIRKEKGKTKKGKSVYSLRYYGQTAIDVLDCIQEYLIEKKDQAETMIQLFDLNNKLKQAKRKDHNEH